MHISLEIEKPALFPKQSMHCVIQFLAVLSGYWFADIGIEMKEMKVHEFFEICILLVWMRFW